MVGVAVVIIVIIVIIVGMISTVINLVVWLGMVVARCSIKLMVDVIWKCGIGIIKKDKAVGIVKVIVDKCSVDVNAMIVCRRELLLL